MPLAILVLRSVALAALLLPWLNPFASGPSPAVMPWLVSLMATGLLLLLVLLQSFNECLRSPVPFSQRWVFPAASAWLLAGVLSSGIALLQYFGATSFFEPWVNHARLGEAYANLRQRNQFATLTNMALSALIWFAISKRFAHRAPGRVQWVAILLGCLLAVGNAASQSRTGVTQLGLVCALCAVWGLWRHSMVRNILMAAVITYTVASFLLPVLVGFDLSTFGMAARLRAGDLPCSSRITLWSNVLHLIAQKPWFGWGWGELDYAHYITLYDGPRFCEILDNAHNLPLHLAVELGIPVALLVCGVFTWWALRQQPWREADPTRQLAWSVLAAILLHSMLEYPLWYGPFQMAFWICIGLLWRPAPTSDEVSDSGKNALNSLVMLILKASIAIILIATTAFAAWDYNRISQIYLAPEARDAAYRSGTLEKINESWFFDNQLRFAQLLVTTLTSENAEWTFNTATALLHYSPEPRVIEKIIESAVMLKRDAAALEQIVRYRAAFPVEYAQWASTNAKGAAAIGALK
jgi:O-antigen ligase